MTRAAATTQRARDSRAKRRAVLRAWRDGPERSSRSIASEVGCSHVFAGQIIREASWDRPDPILAETRRRQAAEERLAVAAADVIDQVYAAHQAVGAEPRTGVEAL